MSVCLVIALVEFLYYIYDNRKNRRYGLKGIVFRHSIIFSLCFFVVFFQCDIDFVFGIVDGSDSKIWIDKASVSKALALSIMAYSCFLTGYRLFQFKETNWITPSKTHYHFSAKYQLCLLCAAMLLLYIAFVPREYLYGGYALREDSGSVNVILVLLQAVYIGMFSIFCYEHKYNTSNKSYWQELKIPILLLLFYIGIVILSGRRTEAIRMSVLFIIAYAYAKGKKVNYKIVLPFIIISALLFSVVGFVRSDKMSGMEQGFREVSSNESLSPFTSELSHSVNTLHTAVSFFPEKMDYTHGSTFFPNFLILVPGLDRIYLNNFVEKGTMTRSADVITYLGLSKNETYGMGSSIVADVYISFGPIGVFLIFIILGCFIRYLEVGTFCIKKSPFFLVLSFGCCSQFMFACRGAVSNLFLSWSYATLIVLYFVLTSSRHARTLPHL